MAPYSSTLAWGIPWTEEPGGLQYVGLRGSDTTERLPFHFSLSCIGGGDGNPLQCSCLENPRDGGGEAVPGDLFSGTVSPEVWRTSGTQITGEGKTTWTGLCSVGEV